MRLLGILPIILLLTSCGTNYNDVMSQWVQAQEKVAQINAQRDIEVAKAKVQETLAMVNADAGGTKITDPVSGFVTEVKNPNPFFYANGGVVTKTTPNSLQSSHQIVLPQKQPSWFEVAAGYTAGILDKTINVALNNAAGVFSIVEQNKTQRAIAEYNYLSDSAMFSTMGGFGTNMENTASNAISGMSDVSIALGQNMQTTAESAVGQMYLLGRAGYESIAYSNEQAFGAIETIATEAFENPLTNTMISTESSNASTFTTTFPDWFTWPVVTPTP